MLRTKKLSILIIALTAVLIIPAMPARAATPFRDIVAVSAMLAEADSGTVLFGHNTDRRHPADGLARIMTLLLAVTDCTDDDADSEELVVMTDSAWLNINANSATIGISPGEEMPLIDLMYCAYMVSASEACNMIAEHLSGSVESFVKRMNERAIELGCKNTNFSNANGQYNVFQYTTATDQFLIFREALSNSLFAEITGTYRYTTGETNMSESRNLVSSNSLLNTGGKYYFSPCASGLASATFEGGYSFIAFAEADELSLISVVLGSDLIILEDESTQIRNMTETRRLFEWGFSHFGWRTILSPGIPVDKAPVLNGDGADTVNLSPESSIRLLLDNDVQDSDFKPVVTLYADEFGEILEAPVAAGEVLGEMILTRKVRSGEVVLAGEVRDGIIEYDPVLLVANTSIELHRLVYIKRQVQELLSGKPAKITVWVLAGIVVLYIALVIRYNVIRHKRLHRIKEAKRKLAEERRGNYDDYD